jgi:hypothetical protein
LTYKAKHADRDASYKLLKKIFVADIGGAAEILHTEGALNLFKTVSQGAVDDLLMPFQLLEIKNKIKKTLAKRVRVLLLLLRKRIRFATRTV